MTNIKGKDMTESCCTLPHAEAGTTGADRCPTCSRKGEPVGAETINALARPGLQPDRAFPAGYVSANPDDPTLNFCPGDTPSLSRDDVMVRVGFKVAKPPHLVCYYFDHTREDIQREYRRQGESHIEASIREQVSQGVCSCEVKNPTGRCCLGEVRADYKELAIPQGVAP